MKKLLVHLHIFYHEQVDYFIYKFENIKALDWDLIVTFSEPNEESDAKIRSFKPDTKFLQVENVGYDVWPFVNVLQQIDFSEYEYVLKLHTKGSSDITYRINGLRLKDHRWRNILVDSMIGSPRQLKRCIRLMDENPDYGFVCAYELGKKPSKFFPEDLAMLQKEAKRIGLSNTDGIFVAGTMFLARLDALKIIKRVKITAPMFRVYSSRSHSGASLAHVYERLLCFAIYEDGYTSRRVFSSKLAAIFVFFHRASAPLFKFIFSLEREGEKKEKYLTLFGVKIKLDNGKE